MLKIIEGSFTSGAHEYIREKIEALIKAKKPSVFLIVPEQHTLSMEKEMSEVLAPSAPLYFEVTNFTRLADTVFRKLGGIAGEHSTRTRRALVMWEALASLAKEEKLKVLKVRGGVNAGLVNKAIAAINEAESFGAESEKKLDDAIKIASEKNARLASKLEDLKEVSHKYKELLLKYGVTGDELYTLADKLRKNPEELSGAQIFIEGFTSFTEPQYELIKILMERASLTVSLTIPKSDSEAFEYKEPRCTKSRLMKLGGKIEKTLDGAFGVKSAHLYEISKLLFKTSVLLYEEKKSDEAAECAHALISEEPDGSLRVIEAKTPYEECVFVAEDIKRRVCDGASYSDFLIAARHAENYVGTLDDALKKSGVPHFFAKPSGILAFEGTKHLISAISCVAARFAREELISYMKSGFSGVTREACDEFELYADTWQLTEKSFLDEEKWNMNPDGYASFLSNEACAKLDRIHETKKTVIPPLKALAEKFKTAKAVRDYASALYEFMEETRLYEKIQERAKLLRSESINEKELAEENEALFDIIIKSLEDLVGFSGDALLDANSFREMLMLVFGEARIRRIPSTKDEVTVGSADSIRRGAKHVYIIGAVTGEFPSVPRESAFFTDKEKLELKNYDIDINTDTSSEYDYARELFYFSRVFASASDSLTIVYTTSDFSFKPTTPSEPVKRILKLCRGKLSRTKVADIPLNDRVYSKSTAISLAAESPELREALLALGGYEDEIKKSEASVKNDFLSLSGAAAALEYEGEIKLSPSEIDKFIDCPLAHFLGYKLSLSENAEAKFDSRNVGSFVHAVLENLFNKAAETGKTVNEFTPDERKAIAFDAADAYLAKIAKNTNLSQRQAHVIDRIKRTLIPVIDDICTEFSNCKFEVKLTERKIGDSEKDASSPERVEFKLDDGSSVKIGGIVDRIDAYKSGDRVYLRVIDYKTGAKDFSKDDLKEGRNLQMFLYLKALINSKNPEFLKSIGAEEGDRLIPAGVIYVKTEFGDAKISHGDEALAEEKFKKKQERRGMILNDKESIFAMNTDYLPVSFRKGTDSSSDILESLYKGYDKFLYTEEEFDELIETTRKSVEKTVLGMKSGNLSALPMKTKNKSPCEYCSFKPICRNVKQS